MLQTSSRLLRMLSLLQSRRQWSGKELSERLEIDARTVRRDIDKLRELGYPVRASSGLGGGYQLGPGTSMPPVLLSDDEAVAVAFALRTAAGSVGKMEEVAIGLLAKLDQVLPNRLRKRASALHAVTISLPSAQVVPPVDVLSRIASCCRDHMRLKLAYKDRDGKASSRIIEPLRLAHTGSRWYLVAWDTQREDWRTFRVDRIERLLSSGPQFVPRKFPEDIETYVKRSIRHVSYRYKMRLRLKGTLEELEKKVPRWCGPLEAAEDGTCTLTVGAESVEMLASMLVMTATDFEILDAHELLPELRTIVARLVAATR
ncbi:MAG TPA: YafY family protein [Steroidobacteraceae bacterium]|nr:YafY family protein [Steroidobacteraceae bacterium]